MRGGLIGYHVIHSDEAVLDSRNQVLFFIGKFDYFDYCKTWKLNTIVLLLNERVPVIEKVGANTFSTWPYCLIEDFLKAYFLICSLSFFRIQSMDVTTYTNQQGEMFVLAQNLVTKTDNGISLLSEATKKSVLS